MTDDRRSIELDVEVAGTPDEVWRAIATGPGISSWYVPHRVEERDGGAAEASFGPGPEMQVSGRVAAWDPPHRVVFDGGEEAGDDGMAFEWLVEAREAGSCVVRLVHSGFGTGADWDDQFDAMTEGWRLFLFNLQLHLQHFAGRTASTMLPTATWRGTATEAWPQLAAAMGIEPAPALGEHVRGALDGGPVVAGAVVRVSPVGIALLLAEPAEGTAFLAAEQVGDQVSVSVWSYLYGDDRERLARRDEPRWRSFLEALSTE